MKAYMVDTHRDRADAAALIPQRFALPGQQFEAVRLAVAAWV